MEKEIRLSEMNVGDRANRDGIIVELADRGREGGCQFDLWLKFKGFDQDFEEEYPSLVIDRTDVAGVEEVVDG